MNWGSSVVCFQDEADAARGATVVDGVVAAHGDTNVLAIKFDMLQNVANMQTGAPIRCSNPVCAAVLSHLSVLQPVAADDPLHKRWECEFCGTTSEVECAEGEQPRADDVTFLLEAAPPPVAAATTEASASASAPAEVSTDDSLVVFAVDVSRSMDSGAGGPVSRLQAAKEAVIKQLDQLENEHPHRRVALITFSEDVNVYGDCSARPRKVSGQVIEDREQLMAAAMAEALPESVRERKQAIATQVNALQTESLTALGPGLLLAVQLAGRVPGSRVVLCTDGCANRGLGMLDMSTVQSQSPDQGPAFYQQLSEKAKQLSVTVNVISFQGTDCRLIELGGVADATGGVVSIVDATDLEVQLRELIENRIVATLVEATLIAHRLLYWDDEFETSGAAPAVPSLPPTGLDSTAAATADANAAPVEPPGPKSRLRKTIGNVMAQTTLTFRFGLRPNAKLAADSKLPFQAQIKYRDATGNIALRVLSQWREQTRDASRARNLSNVNVLGTYAAQSSAAYMSRGQFHKANANLVTYSSLACSNSASDPLASASIVNDLSNLQAVNAGMLGRASAARLQQRGMDVADGPGAAACAAPAPMEDAANEEESTTIRQAIDDRSAINVYRAKKSSYI